METVLATLFAVLAGAATALSPCVLPVLPIALASGASGGRRRPLGVALGLAVAFAFAALVLTAVLDGLGLPDGTARLVAVAVLAGFGVALLVPPLGAALEARLARLGPRGPVAARGDGLRSGLLLGASLGLVYAPCAGPVLAAVVAVDLSLSPTRALLALAYGIGAALALLALMLAGRGLVRRLSPRAGRLQQGLGAVMVTVAVLFALELDRDFQTAIADELPAALVNPTGPLEGSGAVERALDVVVGRGTPTPRPGFVAVGSGQAPTLPDLGAAPDFTGTQGWVNTAGGRPLRLRELRGRVVLVDFWTYSCINCLRTLPQLRAWDARYRAAGLTIVGVHTPEFAFERDPANVRAAVAANRIAYPVAQDNEFATWHAYLNRYWPTKYLVDAQGRLRYVHAGEGEEAQTERALRALLAEAGRETGPASGSTSAEAPPRLGTVTPETYVGWAAPQDTRRWKHGSLPIGVRRFGEGPVALAPDQFALRGTWKVDRERATARRGARIDAHVRARRVFLVLGAHARPGSVAVELDGRPLPDALAGEDVRGGVAHVGAQRLYRLVDLGRTRPAHLRLRVGPGVSAWAFTFG